MPMLVNFSDDFQDFRIFRIFTFSMPVGEICLNRKFSHFAMPMLVIFYQSHPENPQNPQNPQNPENPENPENPDSDKFHQHWHGKM